MNQKKKSYLKKVIKANKENGQMFFLAKLTQLTQAQKIHFFRLLFILFIIILDSQ